MYLNVYGNESVPSRLLYRTQGTTNEHTYLLTCCYTLPLSATNFQEKEGGEHNSKYCISTSQLKPPPPPPHPLSAAHCTRTQLHVHACSAAR